MSKQFGAGKQACQSRSQIQCRVRLSVGVVVVILALVGCVGFVQGEIELSSVGNDQAVDFTPLMPGESQAHVQQKVKDSLTAKLDARFGILNNEQFNTGDLQESLSISPSFQFKKRLARDAKFERPPKHLREELAHDRITDYWETNQTADAADALSGAETQGEKPMDYQPVIGILTQPVAASKLHTFNYKDYILEVNEKFIKWAGSRVIAIPYDIADEDLNIILPQINGFLFTGGALDLIDRDTGEQHPYYKTAKKIYNFSKYMKDVKHEDWPLLGICQGLEVISVILAEDDIDVLDTIIIYGQNLPVNWSSKNAAAESRMFKTFPRRVVDTMTQRGLVLHAHTYSVSLDTFNKYPLFRKSMKILQTDFYNKTGDNIEFIDAMEAHDYPIFASMYHPEYQLLDFIGPKKWRIVGDEVTDEIAFRFSLLVNRLARTNSNRMLPEYTEFLTKRMFADRIPAQPFPMIGNLIIFAYGYIDQPKMIQQLVSETENLAEKSSGGEEFQQS